MKYDAIKVIDSGEFPKYMIYENNDKILIYKIVEHQAMKKGDEMYSMFQSFPCKIIDGRLKNTSVEKLK